VSNSNAKEAAEAMAKENNAVVIRIPETTIVPNHRRIFCIPVRVAPQKKGNLYIPSNYKKDVRQTGEIANDRIRYFVVTADPECIVQVKEGDTYRKIRQGDELFIAEQKNMAVFLPPVVIDWTQDEYTEYVCLHESEVAGAQAMNMRQ
jgi:hypothetical protein